MACLTGPLINKKRLSEINLRQPFDYQVNWLGLEPRTPSLKVMCSTN